MTSNIFLYRNTYSLLVLLLVLTAEITVVIGLKYECPEFVYWPLTVLIPIIILGIVGWLKGKELFLPNSSVFTDLMANAIAPTWLGALYLLFFIVHIGWISDGTLNLFQTGFQDVGDVVVSIIAGFVGMFCLICFFPEAWNDVNSGNKIKVFVSGISQLPTKPNPYTGQPSNYPDFNLRPLVRMLQFVVENEDECELLILKSNLYATSIPTIIMAEPEGMNINSFQQSEYDRYGQSDSTNSPDSANQKLDLVIRKVIWQEFIKDVADEELKKKKIDWLKSKVNIRFTLPCDYNDFPTCFKTLKESLEEYSGKTHKLYFNLTPGTAVVSSVVTLLSIDSNRELYYYIQVKDSNLDDSKRLRQVEKKKIPLENLLSQALQTIKER